MIHKLTKLGSEMGSQVAGCVPVRVDNVADQPWIGQIFPEMTPVFAGNIGWVRQALMESHFFDGVRNPERTGFSVARKSDSSGTITGFLKVVANSIQASELVFSVTHRWTIF